MRKHEPGPGSSVQTLDLFAEPDSLPKGPADSRNEGRERQADHDKRSELREHVGGLRDAADLGQGAEKDSGHKPDLSIEGFARRQEAIYAAGKRSATEYWAARGKVWP